MDQIRQQLSLFIPDDQSTAVEEIRARYNPVQYKLIKSHITLCREDEIGELENVRTNLLQLNFGEILLDLGKPKRFGEGKGVLIPMLDTNQQFQQLRALILKNGKTTPRIHEPHLTLMHPRNSSCTEKIFKAIQEIRLPSTISFSTISLIEQPRGQKWKILDQFKI